MGNTIYFKSLKRIADKYNIVAALCHAVNSRSPVAVEGTTKITMDGRDIAKPCQKNWIKFNNSTTFRVLDHFSQSRADFENDMSSLVLLKRYVGYIRELGRLLI